MAVVPDLRIDILVHLLASRVYLPIISTPETEIMLSTLLKECLISGLPFIWEPRDSERDFSSKSQQRAGEFPVSHR